MEIRKMQSVDYEGLYELWMSCNGMRINNLDDSRDGIVGFLRRNPDICYVADEAGKIVGGILTGFDGRRAYIYHTAVHPDYRMRGIARGLVDHVMDSLEGMGVHKVALVAFEKNEAGNRFWEKMGFTLRDDLVYRNRAIVEMTKIDT